MTEYPKIPMQPMFVDLDGRARFRANKLVQHLLNNGPFTLNKLCEVSDVPREDWEQLAMLIGYSLGGFGELSYVSDEAYNMAEVEAARLKKGNQE